MSQPTPSPPMAARLGKTANRILWIDQGLLSAGFLIAGSMKFAGHWMMIRDFEAIGFGQWFRYLTGTIELASAVMILIPRLASLAGGLLVCTMIGAGVAHVTKLNQPITTPVILGLMALAVVWFRRPGCSPESR